MSLAACSKSLQIVHTADPPADFEQERQDLQTCILSEEGKGHGAAHDTLLGQQKTGLVCNLQLLIVSTNHSSNM